MILTSMPRLMMWRTDVVDGEAVGDVAAGAVDEERDRLVVVVGELAQPLDAGARGVLLDVADQVDVAQPVARLLAELRADRVDELGDEAFVQFSHRDDYRIDAELSRRRARNKTPARG